ncbi:ABC transporter substrate-binding protein [Aeromonas salmonicida subsp. salmonicida]|uniref:ABC-type hydroxamate-type ferric siderophore transporter, periplasmic binding protein n=1 Tax=Aeromonas salmonicida subsp. salmonicida 01-B526 TaxID=1076135 RepID=A0ABN0DW59_AERSS|nr:ABC transporter substrate-binding protein [Aeromonas salmonicida]EHI50846.1 ABC-type hydroxamate-type ferric siderophore transporter, periplasmic binding protein [Aeromonas salmonicida subsp. salmonicida 01-B526]KHE96126.1 ABC transporter substrate-binding protein [Aeromonas salmonicida subsp. salmonicida]KHE97975.1 ABC transporter substrate-binding protein [Aeromonas salmonicida subsp. salmonicida]KIX25244.1 ABC transporter substrate-binding protein [Aeromonas salmonicida subsp. salmonicida
MKRAGWLLCLLAPLGLQASPASQSAITDTARPSEHTQVLRIATVDWTIAETLLALGVTPLAVGDVSAYRAWVGEPLLPADVVDIGLRAQPNRELLAELKPDRILISPLAAPLAPTLSRIAPVQSIALYDPQTDLWQRLHEATLTIAALVNKTAEANVLLTDLNRELEQMKQTLPAELPPLLVVQFIDERHVRVFGRHSLFEAVMQRLGLRNAWQGETNAWGFSVASIEQFMALPAARLVVVNPIPVGVSERLQEPGLWQHLPLVQQAPVLHLPAVWSFGGVLAARRFATLLSEALQKDARGDRQ